MNNALYEYNLIARALEEKWGPFLEGIDDTTKRLNTAILLENENQRGHLLVTETLLNETGTFSGQTSTATGFDFSAGDGTGAGNDIAPFQHYLLPLVRRVYPNLIANELVGVQPMTSPASLVFYLKYIYTGLVDPDTVVTNKVTDTATAKGKTQPYTEYGNFAGNTWNIDPHYSLQTVFEEAVATTVGAPTAGAFDVSVSAAYTPLAQPVIANTITMKGGKAVIAVSDGTVTDNITVTFDNTGVATAVSGDNPATVATITTPGSQLSFDPNTGVVSLQGTANTITVSDVAGSGNAATSATLISGSEVTLTYDYNMEGNRQLPEMELQVESFPVSAKTRKLRTKWTIEASQDLRAMHNIDAEQELISVLSNEVTAEIDREILNDLVTNAAIRVNYDYSSPFLVGGWQNNAGTGTLPAATTVAIAGSTSFDDRNKALFFQILEVSNQIYRQSLRGAGNWIVTSPEIAAKLESLLEFKPDARTDTQYNLGIIYSGTLNGQFKLYKDPLFPPNLILVGYKGTSFMDAGYFYCPYVPLQLTPTVLDTESFNPRKGLITRYGKVMVENGARMYAVIRVDNLTAVGASNLPGENALASSPQLNANDMATSPLNPDLTATGGEIL